VLRASLVLVGFVAACGSKTGLDVPDVGPRDAGNCPDELCNGADDDCDGAIDDGLACFTLDGEAIEAVETNRCGAAWYSYDDPDLQSANPRPDIRQPDQVIVAVQHGARCDGAGIAVIADVPMDGSGGELRGRFAISPPGAAGIIVSDEPRECASSATNIACEWVWQPCCTDGVMLGPLVEGCVTLTLSSPVGVESLLVHDGRTRTIPRTFGVPFELCAQIRPAVP
jgi:hypothetical protein